MPIKLEDGNEGKMLAIRVTGKLIEADYVYPSPEFEQPVHPIKPLKIPPKVWGICKVTDMSIQKSF